MNKVFVVSVVVAACVFAANAGAKEGKSGFYLTGKAGASVVSLSDQRFLSGDEEETSKYKGGDDHDTVFSGGIAVPVMIFIRSSVFRFVQNWSFTLVEKLIRSIT
ncbi:Tia invasion determinant [Escherichia coli]|nr:Tia invasion determinant [Escherichia coli]CAK5469219.1 Tia invasion determinant [Escherichia coli]